MRGSSRLLATLKSAARYLEANTPTGLTGLTTHPSPRPALIYTYRQTLNKLSQLPSTSVYRQSTEALTKQRLSIVEAAKPDGYDQWLERVKKQIAASPAAYDGLKNDDGTLGSSKSFQEKPFPWDGELTRNDANSEGSNTLAEAERKGQSAVDEVARVEKAAAEGELPTVEDLEVEPPLSAEQVNEIEVKIGAGLIEEVLQVAEGELLLTEEMLTSQAWEPLDEQIPAGQWEYFDRGERV